MLQLSQRPLSGSGADRQLFVDRTRELDELHRAVRHRFNVLLLSERGAGKTSLLRRLAFDVNRDAALIHVVDASTAEDLIGVLDLIDATLALPPLSDDPAERVRHLERAAEETNVHTIAIDGIRDPSVVHQLFGRLRDDLWELSFRWIVAGQSESRDRYLMPPADAFFDSIVTIDELSEDDAAEVLRRRVEAPGPGDEDAADVVLGVATQLARTISPRQPRHLLAAARDVLVKGEEDPTAWVNNWLGLQLRAADLGRSAELLFAELIDLAPVSASDPTLLQRMGWTRSRATQVLRRLEEEGLVVARTEPPDGPGRPRRVYAPNSRYGTVEQMRKRP